MKNLQHLGFALSIAIWSCGISVARATPADLQFSQVVHDFVLGTLALSPVTYGTVGYHKRHGEILEDKPDVISARRASSRKSSCSATSKPVPTSARCQLFQSRTARDIEVMRDAIGATRFDIEEVRSYRHNPTIYVERRQRPRDTQCPALRARRRTLQTHHLTPPDQGSAVGAPVSRRT